MKRLGNLFDKIIDLDNIKLAIYNASRYKRKKRPFVKYIMKNPDKFAKEIQTLLLSDYKFQLPKEMDIRERQKIRHIKIPTFYPDQIIHWALIQVINPIMERGMYRYCCGSVKGRGGLDAKKAVDKALKDKRCKYVFKADIYHFFQSVDIEVLKAKFRTIIKDAKVLQLIDNILDNGGPGLPIGYYTSQSFSNFYLLKLDHYIKETLHIKYYVRYVDDIVLIDSNKKKLHRAREEIEAFLSGEHLKLKSNWQVWRLHSRPIDFVGYRFYKTYTKLRQRMYYALIRITYKIKLFGITVLRARRLLSYLGWAKHINIKLNPLYNVAVRRISEYDSNRIQKSYNRSRITCSYA